MRYSEVKCELFGFFLEGTCPKSARLPTLMTARRMGMQVKAVTAWLGIIVMVLF